MKNKEIEKLLSCDNCVLKECIQCEISWTERKKIREYIEQIENKVKQDIEELELVHDNYIDANIIEGTYETLGEIQYAQKILKLLEEGKGEND